MRIVAWLIPAASLLGYVLTSFWADDQEVFGDSVRRRIGGLLMFSRVPLTLAALVYAASFLLMLYAARLELYAARLDVPAS